WLVGALCAIVPDADVIGFRFGVHYGDLLGHRGLTHSLAFAALLSVLVALAARVAGTGRRGSAMLAAFVFLATASHGVLDAMTTGGLGVAFFAPFSAARYFFPFRPIEVSPIGVTAFFTQRGIDVLRSEAVWIWLPSALLAAAMYGWRRRRRSIAP